MGRRDNQQQNTEVLGRRDRTTSVDVPEQAPTPRTGNFITNAPRNLGELARGEIKIGDVAREIPGTAVRGAVKTADAVLPGVTNFVNTTGNIFGEGLAYATSKDVREQYKAGNLDILPTITKTTQKDLLKDTVAAGIETSILRLVPNVMKMKLGGRAGVGALEGIGYAIAEGMAKDQTADEVLKNATVYGVSGTALNIALPWLGPLLTRQLGRAPADLKAALKKEADVPPTTPAGRAVAQPTQQPAVQPTQQPTSPTTVSNEQLPIGGATKGLSRGEHRVLAQTEDPAYVAGYENYKNSADNVDTPELTGSSNPAQKLAATRYYDTLTPDQVEFIVNGGGDLPPEILRTAFLREASERAFTEGNSGVVAAIARRFGQLSRRFGQEIQFTKNFDELDPTTNIADLLSVRLKAVTSRLPSGQTAEGVIETTVKKGKAAVTANQLKVQQAEDLINSIDLC